MKSKGVERKMAEPIKMSIDVIRTAITIWEIGKKVFKSIKRTKEPKLIIEKIYVANFVFQPSDVVRKFLIAKVRNVGQTIAERCAGYLESEQTLQTEYKLHWADTPYTGARDTAEPIDIPAGESRDLDIAFSKRGKTTPEQISLAVSTSSPIITGKIVGTTVAETVAVAGDIVFPSGTSVPKPLVSSLNTIETEKEARGSWIAIPIALSYPVPISQAYLAPGEYEVKVKVQPTRYGKGDEKRLKLISGEEWDKLDAEMLNKV